MANQLEQLQAILGRSYRVEREIGVGGMATVYLASDLKHGRQVALKVLRAELTAAMGTDRFPREIQIIAQLQHPHIVPLYDSGEAGGLLYYVMPFIDGESLRSRLSRTGPMAINEGVRLLQEIADALSYAHTRGIVHRDIKPDNVMLSGRHAAVTDFGVAKALSASAGDRLTTVGIAVGTPQYMAPEQATADVNIDHRVDIYALGVLGYEMLTGRPLFDAMSAQGQLSAHVLEAPKDIRERRAEVPATLAEVLLKCVAKEPDDRWQSADELLVQLESVASTPSGGLTPTTTRPWQATAKDVAKSSAAGTASKTSASPASALPSSRKWLALVAALVVLAGGGFGAWTMLGAKKSATIERIAVMPIEDISGQDAVFVDAMQDALTNALSRLGTVGVASRSTVMPYKTSPKPIREVASALNLDAVLETTVFRSGDVMRINMQLSDPVTTRSLWSDTYERNVKDVLAAQGEVVSLTAAAVGKVLRPQSK